VYNPDTDFIFPSRVIPALADLRGEGWRGLVSQASSASPASPAHLAFVLLMVRQNGCENCDADSFRAMRGCTACSIQTLQRFEGGDDELLTLYGQAQADILHHLNAQP
jgi:hypothetical protein